MTVRLPEPPRTLDIQTREYLASLIQAIELAFNRKAMTKRKYKNTGTLTKRYEIDQGTATLAELRDYVCTLVAELREGGNIG
jgi:uncharacterized membrane protein (UPF0182 family)